MNAEGIAKTILDSLSPSIICRIPSQVPIPGEGAPAISEILRPNGLLLRQTIEAARDERTAVITPAQASAGFITSGVVSFAHSDLGNNKGPLVCNLDDRDLKLVSSAL
jgi:hypothetical protein